MCATVDRYNTQTIYILVYATSQLLMQDDILWDFQTFRKKHFKIRPAEQVHLAVQIAYGLEYLHSKRIVHRDIAARNILLAGKCKAKVQ